jgi:hypothetical protein
MRAVYLEGSLTAAVVQSALFRVGQNLVGERDILELFE